MKKALLFAILAFLGSAAAVTGVMVKLHQPVVESTLARADSLPAGPVDSSHVSAHDSLVAGPARGDSTVEPAANTPSGVPETRPVQNGSPAAAPLPRRPVDPPPDPLAIAAAYKQVARVLAAMKPPQAAEVLSHLSDDEVEGILRAVGPRQAADFLTNLSAERAGVLSRRLLVPVDREQTR